MYWMRSSALILGNSGVLNSQLHSLKQNENNLFCDRKPFVARRFCGVKNSPVIGYKAINIPDIF